MEKDKLELSLERLDEVSGGEAYELNDYRLRTAYETLNDLYDIEDSLAMAVDYAEENQRPQLLAMYCRRLLNVIETLDWKFNLQQKLASELKKILNERWAKFTSLVSKEFDVFNSNPSLQ